MATTARRPPGVTVSILLFETSTNAATQVPLVIDGIRPR
jgi:hypothetical protein